MLNRSKQLESAAAGTGRAFQSIGLLCLCVCLWWSGSTFHLAGADPVVTTEVMQLHKKAKRAIYDKEWNIAIRQLRKLETDYPDSPLRAEALYWLAYSLEKMSKIPDEGRSRIQEKEEAMAHLDDLLEKAGNSEWADDAQILKVRICFDLVELGQKKHKKYLHDTAMGDDKSVDLKLVALTLLRRIERKPALEQLAKLYIRNNDAALREKIIFLLRRAGEDNTVLSLLDPKNRKGSVLIDETKGRIHYLDRDIVPPRAMERVDPIYPREALEEGITGNVTLNVMVDKHGRVFEAEVEGDSHPMLVEAAVKAIKQWRYKPYTHLGLRIEVRFKVSFQFLLIND